MPQTRSTRGDVLLLCPVCSEQVRAAPITRIDGDASPGLLLEIARCTLNTLTCPVCRHSGVVSEAVALSRGGKMIVYVPVDIPSNRKARFSAGLLEKLKRAPGAEGEAQVCYGPAQLRRVLPDLPWSEHTPAHCPRFDAPGSPRRRLSSLRRALKERPDDPDILAQSGRAHHELGELGSARRELEGALKMDPANPDTMCALASVYLDQGAHEQAQKLLDRAVGLTHEPYHRYLAGVAAYRAGNPRAALERLQHATKKNPGLLPALVWQAVVSCALGDRAGALNALWQAAEHGLNSEKSLREHPELDLLQTERGFQTILARVRSAHGREADLKGARDKRGKRRVGGRDHRGERGGPRKPRPRAR